MEESTQAAFDDLKAQARAGQGSELPDFADVEAELEATEQEAEPAEPTTSQADDSVEQDDSPPDYKALLDRLKQAERARDREAGEKGNLLQRLKDLESRLEQSHSQPQSEGPQWEPLRASPDQIEAYARQIDPNWDEVQHDEYKRHAYDVAYNMVLNSASGFMNEINQLKEELSGFKAQGRLQELGLDRQVFDGLVAEVPGLQKLSFDEQIEAISRLGKSFGSGGLPSPAQGAPTIRRQPHIEQPMGGGSANDPRTKTLRELEKAYESGDKAKIRQAASPLWEHWKQSQGF